jgi:hypothetical protein
VPTLQPPTTASAVLPTSHCTADDRVLMGRFLARDQRAGAGAARVGMPGSAGTFARRGSPGAVIRRQEGCGDGDAQERARDTGHGTWDVML